MIYLTRQDYVDYFKSNNLMIKKKVAKIKLLTGYTIQNKDIPAFVLFIMSNNLKDTIKLEIKDYPFLNMSSIARVYHSRKLLNMRYRIAVINKNCQEISYESF